MQGRITQPEVTFDVVFELFHTFYKTMSTRQSDREMNERLMKPP